MISFLKPNFSKIKYLFIVIFLLFFMIVFISFPEKYLKSSYKGIILWAVNVLPSLLPFFFLTALLTKTASLSKLSKVFNPLTKRLFNLNGICFYPFIMSVLSGYPVGSTIVYELYKNNLINKDEATKISILSSTSGPLFMVGTVGICMFENKTFGFIILTSHILSAILSCLTFRFYKKSNVKTMQDLPKIKVDNPLYESMYSSIISVLIVGGFISISYVLVDILIDFNILYPLEKLFSLIFKPLNVDNTQVKGFLYGLVECTRGSQLLALSSNKQLSVSLATSIISFGGLSIFLQSIIYLKKANVNILIFLLGKLLHLVYSFIISYVAFILIF